MCQVIQSSTHVFLGKYFNAQQVRALQHVGTILNVVADRNQALLEPANTRAPCNHQRRERCGGARSGPRGKRLDSGSGCHSGCAECYSKDTSLADTPRYELCGRCCPSRHGSASPHLLCLR